MFASLPALETRLVFFSTEVADVSDQLDPVEMPRELPAGHGHRPRRGLRATLVTCPERALFLLISDLYEGGDPAPVAPAGALKASRVQVLCVLALNDAGRASFDRDLACKVAPGHPGLRQHPAGPGAGRRAGP